MPIYRPTPRPPYRGMATMLPLKTPSAPAPTPAPQPPPAIQIASPPSAVSLAQAPAGALMVTWTVPTVDATHGAAAGFNLQFSLAGAGVWTSVSGVGSPYLLTGLEAGAAYDVQLQSSNAAGLSAWSATSTLTTVTAAPNMPSGVTMLTAQAVTSW